MDTHIKTAVRAYLPWILIGILVLLGILWSLFWAPPRVVERVVPAPQPAPIKNEPGYYANQTPPAVVTPETITHDVIIQDKGFSPEVITIHIGEVVVFKNQSALPVWPESVAKPTANVYPEKGGCVGNKFDACFAIDTGGQWSFRFDRAGTWKYQDHLAPSHIGTIIVE